MLKKIDILEELKKERKKVQDTLIQEVNGILIEDAKKDLRIENTLKGNVTGINKLPLVFADEDKLYSEEQIKSICIRYRLRFLPVKHFKGDIPYEATSRIKELERFSNKELNGYRILAPRRLFDLRDADADPLLFVPAEDGNYYLIHKWGTDMSWHRRILSWPLQSLENLAITLIAIAIFVMLITPNELIVPSSNMADNSSFGYWGYHRIAYFFHFLILAGGFSVFVFFSFFYNFSDTEWNRKTFN